MNTENDRRIDYIEFPCADPEGNVLAVWSE
jgi:hypothetical protein